jgi:hypothetical protein
MDSYEDTDLQDKITTTKAGMEREEVKIQIDRKTRSRIVDRVMEDSVFRKGNSVNYHLRLEVRKVMMIAIDEILLEVLAKILTPEKEEQDDKDADDSSRDEYGPTDKSISGDGDGRVG